jgi:hypothetical protein
MESDMEKKTLMYAISNSLSKSEAIRFAKTLDPNEKWYLACVHRNPKARHIAEREKYVIVRDVKKGEIVPNGYALFAGSELVGAL